MRIRKVISACLLSTVAFFGQCALAQTHSEEDANRCSDAVVKRLAKHFRLTDFAYPERGVSDRHK